VEALVARSAQRDQVIEQLIGVPIVSSVMDVNQPACVA
jgi:hypothetical protein